MFALTQGDVTESEKSLQQMLDIQVEIVEALRLSYRVLDMATEELGAAAYRKYDIEVWMPSKGGYGEISSASNCTSYQARRLNICYLDNHNEKKLAHTINGTALAVPRIIQTILETNYDEASETVLMPECLLPWLPFDKITQ